MASYCKPAYTPRKKKFAMRRYHDIGGLEEGVIDQTEATYHPWEKRVKALLQVLARRPKPLMNVDQLRRGIEELAPDDYDKLSYYERWAASIVDNMVRNGHITLDELARKMSKIEKRNKEQRQNG
ncbi:MAG: hypothetical protein ACI8P2_000913 [Candidatus Latescibacterota bacterium]|jgi:hypothetical protein